jgi:penicillin-binding protein 1C
MTDPAPLPPRRPWRRRWLGLLDLVPALLLVAAFGVPALDALNPPPTTLAAPSTVVVDRNGELLRAFTDGEGRWRLPVTLAEVDPDFVRWLVAYEDKRFRDHVGVDPRAAARAAGQAVAHGRVVSGASTLTMQTVRLLTEDRRRTADRKLVEALRALQLERRLSKDDILALYLNAAPYGGNIEGVRAASLAWFGREPARLTLAEAALLIALPQSPEGRRPDRHPAAARAARDRVVDRLLDAGLVSPRDAAEAKSEAVPTRRRPVPMLAPHLARRLMAERPDERLIRTTLDRDWQAALETLAAERVTTIGPRVSAAILVADLETGAVRASVGSSRLLDETRAGFVDMTLAIRSPGSTLKPFIYGLAIEAGLIAPGTLVEDRPVTFDGYEPDNFDEEFRGLVTAAEALKESLNIPAVRLLDALGPVRLASRLRQAGARVEIPVDSTATLAIGLGGFGTRLVDLAELYTALPREGRPVKLVATPDAPWELRPRVLEPRAARSIAAILSTMRPPRNAPPGEIAYKTGTSYGNRDAWAVGWDGAHVVAVWVGRPDGTPVAGITGWTDAAPLLFDAFARIGRTPLPPAAAWTPTAELPPPLQRYGARTAGARADRPEIRIAFPPAGSSVSLSQPDGTVAPLVARVLGRPADVWLLNGRPLDLPQRRRSAEIPVTPGHHTLTVVTADGASGRVEFTVE